MVYDPFYIFILSLILIGIFLFDCGIIKKGKSESFFVVYVFLALVAEFRYGVSPDTMNYMTAYEYIPSLNDITTKDFANFRFDVLYTLVNSFAKTVFDSFLGVQLIHGILFYIPLYRLIKYLHIDFFYILLVFYLQFYFLIGMCLMRQGMAVGVLFYAIPYLIGGKMKRYYGLCVLAFLLHASAVLAFLFPLLRLVKKLNIKLMLVMLLLIPFIIPFIFKLLYNVALMFGGALSNYGARYVDSIADNISVPNVVKNIVLFFFMFVMTKPKGSLIMYCLGFLFLCLDMASENLLIAFRFKDYLFPFYLFVFCRCFQNIKLRKRVAISVAYLALFFYQPIMVHVTMFTVDTKDYLVPYASYLSNKNHMHYNRLKLDFVRDYMY